MTYPDFIICPKCKSRWNTKMGYHPDIFDNGICPKCGWHFNKEYKPKFLTQYHLEPVIDIVKAKS